MSRCLSFLTPSPIFFPSCSVPVECLLISDSRRKTFPLFRIQTLLFSPPLSSDLTDIEVATQKGRDRRTETDMDWRDPCHLDDLPSDVIEHIAFFGAWKQLSSLLSEEARRRFAATFIQSEWRRILPPRLLTPRIGDRLLLLRSRNRSFPVIGRFAGWRGDLRVVMVRGGSRARGSHLFFDDGPVVRVSRSGL